MITQRENWLMKNTYRFLCIVACMLIAWQALGASPTDSLRSRRLHLDLGVGLKGMQYTGPLWDYYHSVEQELPQNSQFSRIPLPSPSMDWRLRFNLSKHWFLSQGLSVGTWLPYTKCRRGESDYYYDMWGDEIEIMLMASFPFGGGFQTGKNHFSAQLTPNLFLGGIQRVRSSMFTSFLNAEPVWVNATISTADTDYWGSSGDPFVGIFTKYGMNRLVWSASLRYDRDIKLFGKRAMLWGSLEMGLTPMYREFDVWMSIYNFSEPGMSSSFQAANLGCMFSLF